MRGTVLTALRARSMPVVPGIVLAALATSAPLAADAPPAVAAPLVAAAGDIACDPNHYAFNGGRGTGEHCRQLSTSRLLGSADRVLPLGDIQYENGRLSKFRASYDRSWGRFKAKTRPVIGNHEYGAEGGPPLSPSGYFDYFGRLAGPRPLGYYSFDLGDWHLIALNSMCKRVGGCGRDSRQERWLRDDLARNRAKRCVLAYWHHPRFSSGPAGSHRSVTALWAALHEARADVVLVGHDHFYEQFAPQSAAGIATRSGPREFMVGTGGRSLTSPRVRVANSRKRVRAFGVLRLRLGAIDYRWSFVRAGDGAALDRGSASCV
jgi:acid phosphatase type 7